MYLLAAAHGPCDCAGAATVDAGHVKLWQWVISTGACARLAVAIERVAEALLVETSLLPDVSNQLPEDAAGVA